MNYQPARLHRFVVSSLERLGVTTDHASEVADSLIEAELTGQAGHGLIRLPFLLKRLESGLIDPRSPAVVVQETAATVLLDGANGLGPVVGLRALALAAAKAQRAGIGICVVRRGNHLGAMGFYVKRGAQQGLVTMAFSNTPPAMAPPGGSSPLLGTNPIAAALPTLDEPVIIDLATSQVARGRILKAAQEKRPIPAGWAVDAAGRDTTSADEAIKGALLPIGGAKGFALALLVEALTGVLAAASVGPEVGGTFINSTVESNLGQCFVAIDPEAFGPGFGERMSALAALIRDSPPQGGGDPVRVPGDRARAEAQLREVEGINLPESVVNELEAAARLSV